MSSHSFVSFLASELERLQPALRADLPLGVLHSDIFLENCMFDKEGKQLMGLIDFEEVSSLLLCCVLYFVFVLFCCLCFCASTFVLSGYWCYCVIVLLCC